MKFKSTRDTSANPTLVSAAYAIKTGLAPDGGLYIPESVPALTKADFDALIPMTYEERAAKILSLYLTDYTYDELYADACAAYAPEKFGDYAAPLRAMSDSVYSLELWHGPTCAFKDMALQIMPRLLSRALLKTGETRTAHILVATSGDTGKAALEGYRDVDGVKISVFYPVDGVSMMQKRQMQTTGGSNTYVAAIRGNFDNAQTGVKEIFGDASLAEKANEAGFFFSSANSINWGRLVPQIVYYISAYCDLVRSGDISFGDRINICVPTGNFGNIFAAYLAYEMGLPVNRFICASNQNDVLTQFMDTGVYDRRREFHKTISPSMDILISSNLERLLAVLGGAEVTRDLMNALRTDGIYRAPAGLTEKVKALFSGYSLSDDETRAEIAAVYEKDCYLIDPHTAVAAGAVKKYRAETGDMTKTVTASTASPYKFAPAVAEALSIEQPDDIFDLLDTIAAKTGTTVPAPLAETRTLPVRFNDVYDPAEMPDAVFRA